MATKVPDPAVPYETCVLGLDQVTHKIKLLQIEVARFDSSTATLAELNYNMQIFGELKQELHQWETNMILAWGSLQDEKSAIKKHRPEIDTYHGALRVLFLKLQKFKEEYDVAVQPVRHSETESTKFSGFKLERIKLKPFSGLFEEWQEFRDLFETAVDKNSSFTGAEKMFYLKTSLSGDALSVVASFPTTALSYAEAWSLVKRRYENQREIVFAHIRKLDTLFKANESAIGIRKVLDTLNECVRSLMSLKVPVDKWDVILTYLTLKKLDEETKREWLLRQPTSLPVLKNLTDYLETRAMAISEPTKPKLKITKSVHIAATTRTFTETKIPCSKCGDAHFLYQCEAFKQLNVSERSNLVKSKSLCFNCFKFGHSATKCMSKFSCHQCGRKHHTLLHKGEAMPTVTPNQTNRQASTVEEAPPTTSAVHCAVPSVHSNHVLLGTILANVNDCAGIPQTVRVFVDNGSESCFISENCVDRLGLIRKKSCVSVTGISGSEGIPTKGIITLTLHSRISTYSIQMNALILSKITSDLPRIKGREDYAHIQGLKLSDPLFYEPRPTDILLGVEFASRIKLSGIRQGPEGTPTAEETHFGWMLTGSMPTNVNANQLCHVTSLSYHAKCNVNEPCIHMDLQKFWTLELPDFTQSIQQAKHKELEEYYLKTTTRDSEGRYTVHLPFINEHQPLQESRSIAISKFLRLERRLHNDPPLFETYNSYFEEHLKSGMMEAVPSLEVKLPIGQSYYMPYHEVTKNTSTTTKVRIVYNCSSKTLQGPSLNDVLDKGPKLQNDLVPLLIRFRSYPFAFSCDITKFYNQFKVSSDHINFQRLVWRPSLHQEIKDYRLLRLTFGLTSAPYLAIRTYNQLVDEECQDPVIAKIMKTDVLVDNILTGATSIEESLRIQKVILKVMEKGKLDLRKWASNASQLLQKIPIQHREMNSTLTITDNESLFTLGMKWHPSKDQLSVIIPVFTIPDQISKRSVLSHVARVFDPLGLISPITIRAKVFLQKLWKGQFEWDTPLPPNLRSEWISYQSDLIKHNGYTVNRCFTRSPHQTKIQQLDLIGFSDASNTAYSAVVYSRSRDQKGHVEIRLICSRAKVAPVRGSTTPRLELCGAVLLVKLIKSISESMTLNWDSVICYTDSKTVLDWISSQGKLEVFVHNRVRSILELLPEAQWNHVSGSDNPADAPSRGVQSLKTPDIAELWLRGPEWLTNITLHCHSSLRHQEKQNSSNVHPGFIALINNCSSYLKTIRLTAIWLRYITILKTKTRITTPFSPQELESALKFIVRIIQNHSFFKEIKSLNSKEGSLNTSIKYMSPFIGKDNILRVGGRLHEAQYPEDKKHPWLLPTNHPFVINLIYHYHVAHCHAGPSLVLALIREKFWIVKGKVAVKRTLKTCIKCHRANPIPLQQIMSDLPSMRITPSKAFSHTGMDFAGPFKVRVTIGRNPKYVKSYICIFVCMTTKAVHIELVQDLSTSSFLACLNRFVSRRGLPSDVYSDGGKNFIGAKNEVEEIQRFISNNTSLSHTAEQGIKFHVNCPLSPHHGGLWEAAVKSCKTLLHRVVQNHVLTTEEFVTLLCQVEATLNCRPITPMSDDPNDFSVLTPGHFLVMGHLKHVPEIDMTNVKPSRLKRWQLVQHLHQHFWRRWSLEYLHLLQNRPKWLKITRNLEVGDLVLLQQGSKMLGPSQWITARVSKLFPGQDGNVRVAEVKIADGSTYRRPIIRLSPLPINDMNPTN